MNRFLKIAAIASLATVTAACGGQGDDSLGENVSEAYDNQAEQMEAMAENTTNETQADAMEEQAENLQETGEEREEAIDDADVDAAGTSTANAM